MPQQADFEETAATEAQDSSTGAGAAQDSPTGAVESKTGEPESDAAAAAPDAPAVIQMATHVVVDDGRMAKADPESPAPPIVAAAEEVPAPVWT